MLSDELAEKIRVRLVAYVSSRGVDGAEDIAQETLLVLWVKYPHLTSEADLVPLAYNIAAKKIHEAQRKKRADGVPMPDDLVVPDSGPDPYERLVNEEVRDRLRRAMGKLSERCRELIRLRLLGRSTAEIAHALKTRPGTTYVWKSRCLQMLLKEG